MTLSFEVSLLWSSWPLSSISSIQGGLRSLLPFSFPVTVPGISEGSELGQLVFIPFVFHISGIILLQCLMSSDLNILFHIFLLSYFFFFFIFLLPSFLSSFHSFFSLYSFLLSFFVFILDAHISLVPFILTSQKQRYQFFYPDLKKMIWLFDLRLF